MHQLKTMAAENICNEVFEINRSLLGRYVESVTKNFVLLNILFSFVYFMFGIKALIGRKEVSEGGV